VQVKGPEYLDVPAHVEREYRLKVMSFVEGNFKGKVTFTNEKSGEYVAYDVDFSFTPSGTLATYALETIVKQAVGHAFPIENPLTVQVKLTVEFRCAFF
jgi:hypothetical protein